MLKITITRLKEGKHISLIKAIRSLVDLDLSTANLVVSDIAKGKPYSFNMDSNHGRFDELTLFNQLHNLCEYECSHFGTRVHMESSNFYFVDVRESIGEIVDLIGEVRKDSEFEGWAPLHTTEGQPCHLREKLIVGLVSL